MQTSPSLRQRLRSGLPLFAPHHMARLARKLQFLSGIPGLTALLATAVVLWTWMGRLPHLVDRQSMTGLDSLLAFGLMFCGVLFHELMHIAAFFSVGGERATILFRLKFSVLPALSARMMTERSRLSWESLALISAAGPVGAGALALVINALSVGHPWLYWGSLGTIISSLFNLLPVKGFDGYHFIHALKMRGH